MTSPAPAASPPLSASPHQEDANEPASSVKRSSSISSLLNGSPGSSTSLKRPFSSVEGLSINTFHPLYTHTHLPTPISPAAPQSAETSRTPGGVYSSFSLRPLVAEPRGKTTDIVPKPFECSDCGQKFSRAHNLKSHKATHSAYRPFTCDTCSSSFRRMHDLKRHQKLHTGEKPFACSDCHRTFSRLDALNRHRRTENGTACNYRRSSREDGNTVNNITTTHNTTPIMNNFSNNTPSMSLSATAINNTTITATTTTTTTTAPLPQSVIPSAPVSTSIPSPPPAPPDSPHRIVLPLPQQHYPITLSYPPTQSNEPGGQSEMESLRTSFHQLSEQYKRLLDTYIQESSESSKKIHELEVENRVLRSLICEKQGETVKSNILNHTATTADM